MKKLSGKTKNLLQFLSETFKLQQAEAFRFKRKRNAVFNNYQCLKLKFFSFFKAEILDATKGDIINALVTKLTNLMNEQRLNELAKLPVGSMEAIEAMEAMEAEVITVHTCQRSL